MYEAPIDIVVNQTQNLILEQQENMVFQAIQNTGVNVDKEELIKALKYDRAQYQIGYSDGYIDGKKAMLDKIRETLQGVICLNFEALYEEMEGND